jgi:hypothetical protein
VAFATVNGGDITTACTGTLSGTTFTLTADCDTTAPLTVPNGVTVDGGGHTITAHDITGIHNSFVGAVVTNATGATSMTLQNLTIEPLSRVVDEVS